jgi:hypothetical protein
MRTALLLGRFHAVTRAQAAWLGVLAAGLVASSCKCSAPPPPQPAPPAVPVESRPSVPASHAAFWAWVSQHLDELKAIKTGQEPAAFQLKAQLAQVNPQLVYELGVKKQPFEVIISADGNQALFPLVKELVAAAPKLDGATAIAFRPRKPATTSIESEYGMLSGTDLSFEPQGDEERPGLIALVVHVKGLTPANRDGYEKMAFTLIEAVVGEYDMETRIGGLAFVAATQSPAPGAKPLADLPAFVDSTRH